MTYTGLQYSRNHEANKGKPGAAFLETLSEPIHALRRSMLEHSRKRERPYDRALRHHTGKQPPAPQLSPDQITDAQYCGK